MTYINSNLSNREAYAQYGKLDDARMQALFDAEDALDKIDEIENTLSDATITLPNKDFLEGYIGRLDRILELKPCDTLEKIRFDLINTQHEYCKANDLLFNELDKVINILRGD